MKFLDIEGVKTLWSKTNGTVLSKNIDDQGIAAAEDKAAAITCLYDEITKHITYNTIKDLNNNKINTILLLDSGNRLVAKIIILNYFLDEESEEAYINAFVTLKYSSYNNINTFYGSFWIGLDNFSFYSLDNISGAIER